MTKKLTYQGNFKSYLLLDELLEAFPSWGGITDEGTTRLESTETEVKVYAPNDANEEEVQVVIDAHDPEALSTNEQNEVYREEDEAEAQDAKDNFRVIPNWATWTPEEAEQHVHDTVLSGMDTTQIEAWIDGNVNDLASARTALKLIGGELVDLRNICEKLALAVMYLRDIAVRKYDV